MAKVIQSPSVVKAAGNKEKLIEEFIGKVNSKTAEVSIAKMKSPGGWKEPGQTPTFNEYTIVTKGLLRVKTVDEFYDVKAGECFIAEKGEWVQYSTPFPSGAEYFAICVPAFTASSVNRDK